MYAQNLVVTQLVKIFYRLYGTPSVCYRFRWCHPYTLSISHPHTLLILSTHVGLYLSLPFRVSLLNVSIYRFVHAQYALLRGLMAMIMMMMMMMWQRLVKGRSHERLHYVVVSNIVLHPD